MTIETKVALVVWGVAEENTKGGARGEFVWGCGREIRVTCATENAKVLI
jgi:hypothetical protein